MFPGQDRTGLKSWILHFNIFVESNASLTEGQPGTNLGAKKVCSVGLFHPFSYKTICLFSFHPLLHQDEILSTLSCLSIHYSCLEISTQSPTESRRHKDTRMQVWVSRMSRLAIEWTL